MAEELMFWRYEPGKSAEQWVVDREHYLLAIESALPNVEKLLGITVQRPGLPMYDPEVVAATSWIGFSPEVRLAKRRVELAANDATYKLLVQQADAIVEKEAASAKREEARARADILIAADDARSAPG